MADGGTVSVVWTHAAERRLHDLVNRVEGARGNRVGQRARLDAGLTAAFANATVVIVLDLFVGFRPRLGEAILLVDVRERFRAGTRIVKLADDTRLRLEADAWDECRPPGFDSDLVFMSQERRYDPHAPHRLAAIVYQDADRHIPTDRTCSLEEAFLGAVRFGSPEPASVIAAFDQLLGQLGRVFYTGARPADPLGGRIELNPDRRREGRRRLMADSLEGWETGPPADARQLVANLLGARTEAYRDPIDWLRGVLADLVAGGDAARRWAIDVQRGPAHGDLHGRNVRVGLADNRAEVPALYDYEHMHRDNLIGWDFVKLETELKVRAYCHAFPYPASFPGLPPDKHVEDVLTLEQQLAAHAPVYEAPGPVTTSEQVQLYAMQRRLYDLLLALRGCAARHLGTDRGRPEEWEREYHFLLACYGAHTGRYPNQQPHERVAALVSAGTSSAHLDGLLGVAVPA